MLLPLLLGPTPVDPLPPPPITTAYVAAGIVLCAVGADGGI